MFKPLSAFIGLRYVRAKRRNHFISFISLLSMLGIGLGVAVLITVLSVMNGFDKEVKERILGMMPHVVLLDRSGELMNWASLRESLATLPGVQEVTPFVDTQGMLSTPGVTQFVSVTGIDSSIPNTHGYLTQHMIDGSLDELKPGSFNIVLGAGLARGLHVGVGDTVTLAIPEAALTPAGLVPRFKRFNVSGIFEVDYTYDSTFGYINMRDAQKLMRYTDGVTGLNIKLSALYSAPKMAREMKKITGGQYRIYDWTVLNGTYFEALKLEKTMIFLLLMLIIAIAAFNILSMLVMVVTDKQADIAILRTMGAKPSTIMRIFMVQGSVIGVVGTVLGLIAGILMALNVTALVKFLEALLSTQFLSSDVYYISSMPSDLQWADVMVITLISLAMSFLATLYPSWRASKIQPAEALRYE
jgi:lipoprotein-releasing system permease protein